MKIQQYFKIKNGGFASGNNNFFKNYTGNVSAYINKKISNSQKGKVIYFTVSNATFSINKYGYIDWKEGNFLDGQFFGYFKKGVFWNGTFQFGKYNNVIFKNVKINKDVVNEKNFY